MVLAIGHDMQHSVVIKYFLHLLPLSVRGTESKSKASTSVESTYLAEVAQALMRAPFANSRTRKNLSTRKLLVLD